MADHATPNLPSRTFDATIGFYIQLGFGTSWHDKGWLILKRGNIALEFFPYPDLEPADSSFGCCIRLDNLEEFYRACAWMRIYLFLPPDFPELHRRKSNIAA